MEVKMKSFIGALSAVALLASVGVAAAEEASGTLENIDEQMRTITLDDGTTYRLEEGVAIEGLFPGEEVTVSYEEQDGEFVAHTVEPAQQ
jgi:hypothetical protein